ncbi:MAG: secondary thiamine-phosphate synthase enzyme YjbQ [Bacteroidota bacterium]
MITQKEITLSGYKRGYHLVTHEIMSKIGDLPETGILHLLVKHTSAGLTLNENADPSVRVDFNSFMNRLIPENEPYFTHTLEGTDDMPAHLKSSILGASLTIPITNHRLNLGTWQGIYFCEFRNRSSSRHIVATIYS